MKISKKVTSFSLLTYAGAQFFIVGVGLGHHYSQQQTEPIVLAAEAPRYTLQDIRYGFIAKPHKPADLPTNQAFEYKISLVAGTTGTSGDAEMVFPV